MADKDERAARLKAQLRANLKRRKAPGVPAEGPTPVVGPAVAGLNDPD